MRASGLTALEQTRMDSGEPDRYKETIEQLTGRKVVAFLSHGHVEPGTRMEIFFLDKPLKSFSAVELIGSD